METLSSDWKDYEDATQNATALKAEADCIVTRNKKDFSESFLPVYTPAELLELLSSLEDWQKHIPIRVATSAERYALGNKKGEKEQYGMPLGNPSPKVQ